MIHLPLASRVLWPDIGTRRGTIEATDGAWAIVRFERMAGAVRIPAEAVAHDP